MARPIMFVKVTSRGKDPFQFIKEISDRVHFEFQERLVELGEDTAKRMQNIINASGYNLGALSNSIDSEILSSIGGVEIGIGNISKFPKGKNGEIYWEAFNSGFKPGATMTFVPLGAFPDGAPDASKSGGKWIVGAGRWTFFDDNPMKKVVEPLRFVEISAQELRNHIEKEIDRLYKDINTISK